MSIHTSGPWAVNPVNAQVDAFVNGNPLAVCQLLWPTEERTEAETEANAHLIAAAPELLAALKALQVQALQSDLNSPSHEWGQEALEMTRAAIAKATGVAQ